MSDTTAARNVGLHGQCAMDVGEPTFPPPASDESERAAGAKQIGEVISEGSHCFHEEISGASKVDRAVGK